MVRWIHRGLAALVALSTTLPMTQGQAAAAGVPAAACARSLSTADLSAFFLSGASGLLGGDYPRSIPMSDGRVLWLFQDSFIGAPSTPSLSAAGFAPAAGAEAGGYCAHTEHAVRSFQTARGLHGDGICDETTWTALVEASWRLGDRQLLLTLPNLRGDDVADLQSRLARLGFDCGRVDGILGPRTARALADFQSNCGLLADGICGPDTVRSIERVSS